MFDHLDFQRCEWGQVPDLVRTVVWVDPAVTDTDQSDSQGICAAGISSDGKVYVLWCWEQRTSPLDAMTRAIRKALELGASEVGVETDQGGDTWRSVYKEACDTITAERSDPVSFPPFRSEKAGAGFGPKAHRASKMLVSYETARIVHVYGTHEVLERALRRFPVTKPFDLVDSAFWAWHALTSRGPVETRSAAGRTLAKTPIGRHGSVV
jgi:phage terminase large subunit-like protein